MTAGDRVRATLFGNRRADFLVKSTRPAGPVTVDADTLLEGAGRRGPAAAAASRRSPTRTSAA